MKNCLICKYCDEDFAFDEELGEEYPVYTCTKGNDTSLNNKCKDFKEYKPRKYREKDTECDKCEYREKCAKHSSGIDCTTKMDIKTHIIYPQDKCIKRAYNCTDFNNSLEHGQVDIDQWFRTANMPTNEEIKAFKRAKRLGIEIPKDIENHFKECGIGV